MAVTQYRFTTALIQHKNKRIPNVLITTIKPKHFIYYIRHSHNDHEIITSKKAEHIKLNKNNGTLRKNRYRTAIFRSTSIFTGTE